MFIKNLEKKLLVASVTVQLSINIFQNCLFVNITVPNASDVSGKFTIKEHALVQYDEQEGSHKKMATSYMVLLPSAYAVGNDFS